MASVNNEQEYNKGEINNDNESELESVIIQGDDENDMEETLLEEINQFDSASESDMEEFIPDIKNKKKKSSRKLLYIIIGLLILISIPIVYHYYLNPKSNHKPNLDYEKLFNEMDERIFEFDEGMDVNDKLTRFVKIETINGEENMYKNWNNNTGNKNAYIIMLTSEGEDVDYYYMYVSAIVYKLLHKEETRTKRNDVDVIVMVSEDVADWKLKGLHNLGAVIKRVDKIVLDDKVDKNNRWRNCYTKLHMFQMTEYETIIYLDADLVIKKNIDELFDIASNNRKETGRNDFFGAVTDGYIGRIYNNTECKGMINAGLMILTPDLEVYNDLIQLAPKKELYDSRFMEQGLLSYYYADDNNSFNRTRYHIDARYNAQWVSDNAMEFYDKVYVIHQKLGKLEGAQSHQVQKDIVSSIIDWILYVRNNPKLQIPIEKIIPDDNK